MERLDNTIKQLDLNNSYRIFYPTAKYVFFSSPLGIFIKIGYIVKQPVFINR